MSPVAVKTDEERVAESAAAEASMQARPQADDQTTRPGDVSSLPNEALDFAARMFDLARQGSPALIEYLSAGLPPNLTNNGGNTLLMLAAYHGHASLVRSMLELDYSASPSASHNAPAPTAEAEAEASPTGGGGGGGGGGTRVGGRRHAYASGPDPNQLNGKGQSPLAGAVFKAYDDVVRVLVEFGADPLGGTPNAEETAQMFQKWQGEQGYKELFEMAPGRGRGVVEAAEAVPDREEATRVPGAQQQQQGAA